jgi:hypothetical protein
MFRKQRDKKIILINKFVLYHFGYNEVKFISVFHLNCAFIRKFTFNYTYNIFWLLCII